MDVTRPTKMSDDDDFVPRPVAPPRAAMPVGSGAGKQPGVQFPSPAQIWADNPAMSEEKQQAAFEPIRQSAEKAATQFDRHAVGSGPFDAALALLYAKRDKIEAAIEALEELNGER